jgi:hypothetical protein
MATRQPATSHGPATRWSLDDLGAARSPLRLQPRRRASLWRLLAEAALTPPRRGYGRNRHDPACESTAQASGPRSRQALRLDPAGRLVLGAADTTGRPRLPRRSPTPPVQPGKPAKRAPEDSRQGGRAGIASVGVATAHGVWHLGQTRTRTAWATPRAPGVPQRPERPRYAWGGITSIPTGASTSATSSPSGAAGRALPRPAAEAPRGGRACALRRPSRWSR